MAGITSVGVVSAGTGSLVLDAGTIIARVAALLKRSDLNVELLWWLNFAQRELTDQVVFPELRASATINLVAAQYIYSLTTAGVTDYAHYDHTYYRNTTDAANVWGRNLLPFPREFYVDDHFDVERLLNATVPDTGDPRMITVEGDNLIIYPALATGLTGTLTFHYYKLPADLLVATTIPDIDSRWRHYLIWLTYYWAMVMQEKADVGKVGFWERKFQNEIKKVRRLVRETETPLQLIELPAIGLEQADSVMA